MIFLTKATALIALFIFSFSVFAYYPLYPSAPYPPVSQYAVCPYNQSSICYTYTGNVCSMFVPNYQNQWFSACLNQNFFHACLSLPSFPSPWVQNTCYFRGTPCVCAYGAYNGYYVYEPGQVL
ncbi:MAG: hypothetical protein OXJ52_06515 [Oligoflexia bacterium]|nr:hypothetical protein [Oligoflexia bacterium]